MCRLRKRKDSNAEAKMRVFGPESMGREFHELEMGELEKLFDLAQEDKLESANKEFGTSYSRLADFKGVYIFFLKENSLLMSVSSKRHACTRKGKKNRFWTSLLARMKILLKTANF